MNLRRPKYILLGLSRQYYTVMMGSNTVEELQEYGSNLIYYSVYVNKPGLWSSVQPEYLVVSKDDPIWAAIPAEMTVN